MKRQATRPKAREVLAIFANSEGFGLAVMESGGSVLEAYNVVIRPRPVCNKKLFDRLKEKLAYYRPDIVVMEDWEGQGSRKSNRVIRFIKKVKRYLECQNIEVNCYSRNDIRFVFAQFDAFTKYQIAQVLKDNIPKLEERVLKKRKPYESDSYATGIFDAVSLGVTHYYFSD